MKKLLKAIHRSSGNFKLEQIVSADT